MKVAARMTASATIPRLWPVDRLTVAFFAAVLATTLAGFSRVEHAARFVATDLAVLGTLWLIWFVTPRLSPRAAVLWRLFHGCVATPLVFTQVGFLVKGLRGAEYAEVFAAIDRAMFFGVDPLEALERVATPWLTELMQWAYTVYLILPPAVVALLALKARTEDVARACFSLLGVMYLSYVGYALFPTSGPNIHNNLGPPYPLGDAYPYPLLRGLYTFETTLPGVWATDFLRRWMFEVEATKQDCFPSGHTAVALVCWALARRIGARYGRWFLGPALAVTASTVYLRYHYVADVLAGAALAWFALGPFAKLGDRWRGTERGADTAR